MRKYLFILASMAICLIFSSCDRVSGDPKKDADKMSEELIEVASDYDVEKLDKVIDKYVKYYEKAPLKDRVKFIRNVNDNGKLENSEAFRKMTEKESFKNSSAVEDMDMFFKETRKEAREADIWD